MAQQITIPSPLEVTARIDHALAESGLAQPAVEREPLPLFNTLLDEWLVCQGMDEEEAHGTEWSELLPELLRTVSACEIRESLNVVAAETRQLCRAHGSLSIWNQRELDTRVRTMLAQLEQADQHQKKVYKP